MGPRYVPLLSLHAAASYTKKGFTRAGANTRRMKIYAEPSNEEETCFYIGYVIGYGILFGFGLI